MIRINKQVIKDYFKSFFGQYTLSKEQFSLVRRLLDEAECGCCNVTTIYWTNDASPSVYQLRFKDANDNILVQTTLDGAGPQRICVPEATTQLCLNIIATVGSGDFIITGSSGFSFSDTETIGEFCTDISSIEDSYLLSPVL